MLLSLIGYAARDGGRDTQCELRLDFPVCPAGRASKPKRSGAGGLRLYGGKARG